MLAEHFILYYFQAEHIQKDNDLQVDIQDIRKKIQNTSKYWSRLYINSIFNWNEDKNEFLKIYYSGCCIDKISSLNCCYPEKMHWIFSFNFYTYCPRIRYKFTVTLKKPYMLCLIYYKCAHDFLCTRYIKPFILSAKKTKKTKKTLCCSLLAPF